MVDKLLLLFWQSDSYSIQSFGKSGIPKIATFVLKTNFRMIDTNITVEQLNQQNTGNMSAHLGIEFTEITEEGLSARMPVDHRTKQPFGILHGGANATLAETVGSMASYLAIDRANYYAVGLEIKCNHLKKAAEGFIYGTATPIRLGRQTHLWQIHNYNEANQLSCFTTLTMMVMPLTEEVKAQGVHQFLG